MKKNNQYLGIILALLIGVGGAIIGNQCGISPKFALFYVKPFGILFLNSLKLSAIPLVFVSIILGIANIACTNKLSRIGGKAILLYLITTCIGAFIGLIFAHVFQPGLLCSRKLGLELLASYKASSPILATASYSGPLGFLENIVPDNLLSAFSSNINLLQIVVISILFGISFLGVEESKRTYVLSFFVGINAMLTEFLKLIMNFAPFGVFAIVYSLLTEVMNNSNIENIYSIFYSLLSYSALTIFGLGVMLFFVYPCIIKFFSSISVSFFLKKMFSAQIMAFTSSSSSATLPLVITSANNMGIREDISNFILPLGATVNMAGTALYLGTSSMFISQILGIDLSLFDQLKIIFVATFSAVGVAGLPGSSIVAVSILLGLLGIPSAAISLILIPERILDMCRTVINVTGDVVVAVLISDFENKKELLGEKNKS